MSNNTAPLARRNRLLTSCAAAAIAALTVHAPLRAQAAPPPINGGFQGFVDVPQGAIVTTPSATNTRVEVLAPRAILNWRPSDDRVGTTEAIDFLPAGRSADFVNTSNRFGQDYVVLNRILPTDTGRVVAFNGAVRSTLNTFAGGAAGGQVWFYSPGGILVGATGSFNVGSLLLSASNIADADFLDGSSSFSFAAASNSTSAVQIANGARINALGVNSYVALIAPRVVQSGAVTVTGSANYVAAEAVDMTISNNLFDIAVQVGSSVGGSTKGTAALVHDGTTTLQGDNQDENGYGPPPSTDRNAVLVAVPKNDAVTMLVQGGIDYVPASGAQVVGNRIILSGGSNVAGGAIATRAGNPNDLADIRIDNEQVSATALEQTRFGSDVVANATGAIAVLARNTGTFDPDTGLRRADVDFAGAAALVAGRGIDVAAQGPNPGDATGPGGSIRVGGNLDMVSEVSGTASGTGGVRLSAADRSDIAVVGSATLRGDLNNSGFSSGPGVDAVNTRIVEIAAAGGNIGIGGNVLVSANAFAGRGGDGGGSATAGTARIVNSGAGQISIGGDVAVFAIGGGGRGGDGAGGSGTGGTASLEASAGRIEIGGLFDINAGGTGESGYGPGGAGTGGTARIATTGTGAIALNTEVGADSFNLVRAEGRGGFSSLSDGGAGKGGDAGITATTAGADTSSIAAVGQIDVRANGNGGGASNNGVGGASQGGNALLRASGSGASISLGSFVELSANGGSFFGGEGAAPIGGAATGGASRAEALGGALAVSGLRLEAIGYGGIGFQTGGLGQGGTTSLLAAGGRIDVLGDLDLSSAGRGGISFDGDSGYGDGIGGIASLSVTTIAGVRGSLIADRVTLLADGQGGEATLGSDLFALSADNPGGAGRGGTVTALVDGDLDADTLTLDAKGIGGDGDSVSGGDVAAKGSEGEGGLASIEFRSGNAVIGTLVLDVEGRGGNGGSDFGSSGGSGGAGGPGLGGEARILLANIVPDIGDIAIEVDGNGGSGGSGAFNSDGDGGVGGAGGTGEGGNIVIAVSDGGGLTLPADSYTASGRGGGGGSGGTEAGDNDAGGGGTGGDGTGGSIAVSVNGGSFTSSETGYGGVVTGPDFLAEGIGGRGGSGGDHFGASTAGFGGAGGAGTGGDVSFTAVNAELRLGPAQLDSSGTGGGGGLGGTSSNGRGGDGGRGGEASGGSSLLSLSDDGSGALVQNGSGGILVRSAALGGRGGNGGGGSVAGVSSGAGGAATGGDVRVELAGGIVLNGLRADAGALGGDGGFGADADTGYGEESASGGDGGGATGGTIAVGVTSGDVRLSPGTTFSANANGGLGGTSANFAGGDGGQAAGGTIDVAVSGTGSLTVPGLTLDALGGGGLGGNGGRNEFGGNGGLGGSATGGAVTAGTSGAGRLVTAALAGGGLVIRVNGFGGSGGNGGEGTQFASSHSGGRGGNAGTAQGGAATIEMAGGGMDLGPVQIGANATGGLGSTGGAGAGQSTNAPGGSNASGQGGTIAISVADGAGGEAATFQAGSVTLRTNGIVGGDEAPTGLAGMISIARSSAPANGFEIDSLDAQSLGATGGNPIGFQLAADAGAIEVADLFSIQTTNDAALRSLGTGTVDVGGEVDLEIGGDLTLVQDVGATQPLVSAGRIEIDAASVTGATAGLVADRDVRVFAPGPISLGNVTAGTDIVAVGSTIALGNGAAGRDILLNASESIGVGTAQAGDDIEIASNSGTVTVANAVTTGLGEDVGEETGYGPGPGDGSNIRLSGEGAVRLDNGRAVDLVSLTSNGSGVNSAGLIKARDLDVSSNRDIALTDLDIVNGIDLNAGTGSITGRDFVSGESISLVASGDIAVASLTTERSIFALATDIDIGSATTTEIGGEGGSGITLSGTGGVTLGSADSADFIDVSGASFSGGTLAAASFVRIATFTESGGTGAIALDGATAGDFVRLSAAGDIQRGALVAGTDIDATGSNITLASAAAGRDLNLASPGAVSIQQASAGDDVSITAGTTALVGAVATTGAGTDSEGNGFRISIEAEGNLSFGSADAFGDLRLVSREGGVIRLAAPGAPAANLIDAGGSLFVSAADDLNLNSVMAGQDITLISGGAIDTGNLTAPGTLTLDAAGALSADVVRAGNLLATGASIDLADVELAGTLDLSTPGALVLGIAKASSIFGSGSEVRAGTLGATGNISLGAASGNVTVGTAEAGGSIELVASNGAVTGTSLTADGAIGLFAGGDAALGTGVAGTDIAMSGRKVTLTDGNAGRDISIEAGGDIAIGSAKAGDDVSATAGGAFVGTTVITTGEGPDLGDDNGYGAVAQAGPDGSNIRIRAGGGIAIETGTAKGAISLASDTGAIASAKALTAGTSILGTAAGTIALTDATAGEGIDLNAGTGLTGANLTAGTDVRLQARAGDVRLASASAGDDVDVTATGTAAIGRATTTGRAPDDGNNGASVLVTAPGGISIGRIDSAGGAVLRAQNGAVVVSEDLRSARGVEAAGRSVSLASLGALGVRSATASAGNVGLVSAGNLSIESADASGNVSAGSGGTLGIAGTVGGAQIALASRDIAIGGNAQVGSAQRTASIQVTANGAGAPAVIGGSGQGGGYRLDNAEFGRLAAQTVSIGTQGETAALQVDTLTVRQGSVARTLSLSSTGDVEMIGRLTYENAGADNAVRVSAARSFFADAAGAGIAVTNGQGALTGSIDVDARSIVVASRQAQADLASAANIAARDERLGTNDGVADEAGFLRAGSIRLAASERIFVQNSGASSEPGDDRRGLTAGAGGITLVTRGTGPVEIVINGRQDDGAGGFVTGEALIERLTITGMQGAPASFVQGSTVNGCIIGGNNCAPITPAALIGALVIPKDTITALIEAEDETSQSAFARPPTIGFTRLITTEGGPILAVIDDPVTGTGNDDLAIGFGSELESGRVTDRDIVDQPVTGTGNEALQGGTGPVVDIDNSQRDRDEQVNAPVTGTGNEALQSSPTPPATEGSRPNDQPTIDDPVTGAGNEDLQDDPNR